MMIPTALVPIRIAPLAKTRLAHLVPGSQREALMVELLGRVVQVLLDSGLRVVVLSPHLIEVSDAVEVWNDEAVGLNAAIDRAVGRAGVPVLVMHADLPRVSVDDVDVVLDAPGDIVIARSRDGGTNALLLRARLRPAFGPRSALVHARRARDAGLRATVIDRPGLALDVDDAAGLISSSWRRTSSSRRPIP